MKTLYIINMKTRHPTISRKYPIDIPLFNSHVNPAGRCTTGLAWFDQRSMELLEAFCKANGEGRTRRGS